MMKLDHKLDVDIDADRHFNEVRSLQMLKKGIFQLFGFLKSRELQWEAQSDPSIRTVSFGADFDGTKGQLDLIACIFHWFGVSVCNFARLVGFVHGSTLAEFERADLLDPAKFNKVKASVDGYVASVPELAEVLRWRNKVGAHFAITAPHKHDNIATLDMSVVFPITLSGTRYFVGEFAMVQSNSTGTHKSALPRWSVTEVFESLIPRYWPNIVPKSSSRSCDGGVDQEPTGSTAPV